MPQSVVQLQHSNNKFAMVIDFDSVIGLKTLYKGRTSHVRNKINDFLHLTINNLMYAYMKRTGVKFTWTDYGFNQDQREAIINFLTVNDFIEKYSRGFSFNESAYKLSEFHPSPCLFNNIKIIQTPDTKTEIREIDNVIYLKDDDSKFLQQYVRNLKNSLNIPLDHFKRIYTNTTDKGGRIYSLYQTMNNVHRSEYIKIDGENVIELDYRNNHINVLLASFGGTVDTKSDIYANFDDFGLERKEVKKAISIIINAERPMQAFTSKYGSFEWDKSYADLFVKRFHDLFPELNNVKTGHALGLSLQKFEGDVMIELMKRLGKEKVLPVHDSVICKKQSYHLVSELMSDVWMEQIDKNKKYFKGFKNEK